jgi:signal transduction histidine kinase/CheY-like chemotaxis protein
MNQSVSSFEAELRTSHKLVIVILVALGVALVVTSDARVNPSDWKVMLLALLLYVGAAIAWLLDSWKPGWSRWFIIAALVAIINPGLDWLGVPGALALMTIPVALAAAMIGLPAAMVTAAGETALFLLQPPYAATDANLGTVTAPLAAIGAILGVMAAVYHPIHQVTRWSWEHFQQAQRSLEEARDHKAELEQALSDLAQANRQLTRLNVLAQGLRQAADDARTAKEQFVANVSHELRTPLNMITGFSEMILQAPETYGNKIPPALLADLAVIHRNAEHLADLIDDVLDLSQIDAEQMALTKEHVQFHEIVEVATTAVRPLFDSKGLYLETEIADDLSSVFCDRTRIREVLLNLLSNAGRFTERGGVHVQAWHEGNDLVVSVADTGSGITAEDIGKLFKPFQQIDGSIRRRYGGSGLGLCISKRFIELHGGRIWVESKEGIGTTFTFRLPVAPSMPMTSDFSRWLDPHWEYVERTHPSTVPRVAVHPRLVVLETGDALQRLLTRYLDGVEVVPVTDLEEALEELSCVPARRALLVNGASVSGSLERLIASSTTLPSGTPAIICSIPGISETSAALGAADRLVKPVSREALLGALDRLGITEGTVLIVDDEPDALQLFGRMLASSGRGYRVLLARDGQEALNVLGECRPDVILLDLVMPNMDGFQLLERRGQDPALRDIPIIVVSARDPAGRPIVSNALAVMRAGGLSAHTLLACIRAIGETLSITDQPADPMPTAAFSG